MIQLSLLLLLAQTAQASEIEVKIFSDNERLNVIATNAGEKSIQLYKDISLNSIAGNLRLVIFDGRKIIKDHSDGYPVPVSRKTIQIAPGYHYGFFLPKIHVQQIYSLKPGCYQIRAILESPKARGFVASRSRWEKICFREH